MLLISSYGALVLTTMAITSFNLLLHSAVKESELGYIFMPCLHL